MNLCFDKIGVSIILTARVISQVSPTKTNRKHKFTDKHKHKFKDKQKRDKKQKLGVRMALTTARVITDQLSEWSCLGKMAVHIFWHLHDFMQWGSQHLCHKNNIF